MILFGDYHTHTIYTHGTGTVEDNVKVAIKRGLKQIAITEHSFSHMGYGVSRGEYNLMRVEIETLRKKYGDQIDILCGLESNILSLDGEIDLKEDERQLVDILVVGFHKSFKCPNFKSIFDFWWPNVLGNSKKNKKQIEKNTMAYINALRRYKIDVLAHLNSNRCKVDPVAIAKVAKEVGTYIELNGKRIDFSDEEIRGMIDTGVKFIINSDAHKSNNVGRCPDGLAIVEKYNIPLKQVVNLNKIPHFKTYN